MTEVTIRKGTIDDAPTIVEYNLALASETEDKELDKATLTAGVETILQDASKGEYFVAEADGRVIGQIMYTREWSDWRNGDLIWLQSVYVHADYRGQGVFAKLLGQLQQLADENPQVAGLRLYVENENEAAQKAYLKNGFERPGYLVMERINDR